MLEIGSRKQHLTTCFKMIFFILLIYKCFFAGDSVLNVRGKRFNKNEPQSKLKGTVRVLKRR